MKEHKEIKITYDVIDNQVENAKYEGGTKKDLTNVMTWGGEDFTDAAINAMLRFYIECENREGFLASFLAYASDLDQDIMKMLNKTTGFN